MTLHLAHFVDPGIRRDSRYRRVTREIGQTAAHEA
jgi:hypothetical protein